MNIGMRAHDLDCGEIRALAGRLSELHIRQIQFALKKSITNIALETGTFSPGLADYLRQALDEKGVHIAVLGCYINPVHPDADERRKQTDMFREHIQYAKYLGADMIGTETGSVRADMAFDPRNRSEENYQDFLATMRPLVEYAASFGVAVGVEAVTSFTIYSPERMKRFLDDMNMPNLFVIFDPVNMLDQSNYPQQRRIFQEAFDLYGDRIAAVHFKDFIPEKDGLHYALPTEGHLDYPYLIDLLNRKKPHIACLLEEVKEPDVERIRHRLLEIEENLH